MIGKHLTADNGLGAGVICINEPVLGAPNMAALTVVARIHVETFEPTKLNKLPKIYLVKAGQRDGNPGLARMRPGRIVQF